MTQDDYDALGSIALEIAGYLAVQATAGLDMTTRISEAMYRQCEIIKKYQPTKSVKVTIGPSN